jgi:hypothetical protein
LHKVTHNVYGNNYDVDESDIIFIKKVSTFLKFLGSCWNLLNNGIFAYALDVVGKPSMIKGAPRWFHNVLNLRCRSY